MEREILKEELESYRATILHPTLKDIIWHGGKIGSYYNNLLGGSDTDNHHKDYKKPEKCKTNEEKKLHGFYISPEAFTAVGALLAGTLIGQFLSILWYLLAIVIVSYVICFSIDYTIIGRFETLSTWSIPRSEMRKLNKVCIGLYLSRLLFSLGIVYLYYWLGVPNSLPFPRGAEFALSQILATLPVIIVSFIIKKLQIRSVG
ncbi:MAG: hypothetical protein V3V99_03680 [candidate division Zixibacteria bacterium]